ncbi:MAG: phosphoribosylanthranilate isomerase, partial [Limnochordia bacterium]
MIRVKICGITNEADALTAIEAGADALGFIFTTSPRQISPTKAQAIVAALPPLVQTIGVFRNQPVAEVKEIVEEVGLGGVQLHGDEDPNYCLALRQQLPRGKLIKALAVKDGSCLQRLGSYKGVTDGFLLDAYSPRAAGGTGET